jgi:putative ABC transport system permease protein
MLKILKTGMLNLFRNKRRSAFNVLAVSICIGVFLVYSAFMNGEKEMMYGLAIKFLAGHIQIHAQGFDEKSNLMPVDLTLEQSPDIISSFSGHPAISDIKRRIEFSGILSDGYNKIGGMIAGIEPENEQNEIFAEKLIVRGDLAGRLIESGNEVLIGKGLAELFGFKPGDELIITGENKFRQPNLDTFSIAGVFSSGFPLFDETSVFIPLESARVFMGYETDEVNVIHVGVTDRSRVDAVVRHIHESTGRQYEVFGWRHFSPETVSAVEQDEKSYMIIMGILLFLMVFGLLNTMSMNIFERYREIGTMRAMGFRKSEITLMFLCEAFFIGIAGMLIGFAAGSAVNYYTSTVGIELPSDIIEDVKIPFVDRITSKPMAKDYVQGLLIAILAPTFGVLYPVYRAMRKSIVETLYYIR